MSRPLRIHFAGAVYHVMNRGTARQASFLNDGDYQAFLNTLAGMYKIPQEEVVRGVRGRENEARKVAMY